MTSQKSLHPEKTSMSLRDWTAVMGGALGAFMAILDIQVTNSSLREISGSLSLDISESSWISTAYLISEIIVIPLTAFFSKVFGMRKYLILNCLGFVAASVACGLSWDLDSMILFRALQGITGGTLIPMSFQLILDIMPQRLKPVGLTIFGLTVTLAPTLGPSLGGWLTDEYGWRSIFFINIIPGVVMSLALRLGLKQAKADFRKLKNLDYLSLVTLVLGLSSLTYLLEEGPGRSSGGASHHVSR
jgi:DHA2 family multidrug resistance protein